MSETLTKEKRSSVQSLVFGMQKCHCILVITDVKVASLKTQGESQILFQP